MPKMQVVKFEFPKIDGGAMHTVEVKGRGRIHFNSDFSGKVIFVIGTPTEHITEIRLDGEFILALQERLAEGYSCLKLDQLIDILKPIVNRNHHALCQFDIDRIAEAIGWKAPEIVIPPPCEMMAECVKYIDSLQKVGRIGDISDAYDLEQLRQLLYQDLGLHYADVAKATADRMINYILDKFNKGDVPIKARK